MERMISATEARVHFGELLRQVVEGKQPVVVERNGVPQVVVLPVAEYERLRAACPKEDWEEVLHRMVQLGARIRAYRGGKPLTPPEDVIREMREERSAQLEDSLR